MRFFKESDGRIGGAGALLGGTYYNRVWEPTQAWRNSGLAQWSGAIFVSILEVFWTDCPLKMIISKGKLQLESPKFSRSCAPDRLQPDNFLLQDLHTRSHAHHRYKRTFATSVFPTSMTDPIFWRKSWKQRNYTASYYRAAFPWRTTSSKQQTQKGSAAKGRRGGNWWGFTRVSWIQFPMMILVNNEGGGIHQNRKVRWKP